MKRIRTVVLAVATITTTATAEPKVHFNPNPGNSQMYINSIDPELPNIRIAKFVQQKGPTIDYTVHMHIEELPNGSCSSVWEPSLYNIEAPSSVSDAPVYGDPVGLLIDAASPDWFEIHKPCGDSPIHVPLPQVYTSYGEVDQCHCSSGGPYGFPADEIRYLPFRWQHLDSDDWYYGWTAFKVVVFDTVCGHICDPGKSYKIQGARLEHIGFALESEPNTGIIVGGGLCPGDINFDAQRDTFDVFDYLDLYNTMDAAADYDNDGTIDVFDVFAFLDDFQTPCEF